MIFKVRLEQFEGPLDLLFKLIEDKKLDIITISLSKVTEDYLAHLKYFQETDPLNLANFLVIAARLILIKSRALLPFLILTQEEEADIKDLENKLELYRKFKESAVFLKQTLKNNQTSFSREYLSEKKKDFEFIPLLNFQIKDLQISFKRILNEITRLQTPVLEKETVKEIMSIQDKIKEIQNRLAENLEKNFSEFAKQKSKVEIIISFLAMLELIKQKFIHVEQIELFGDIKIIKL